QTDDSVGVRDGRRAHSDRNPDREPPYHRRAMTKRRAVSLFGLLLILVAGVAAALLLSNRRDVTTSSDEAYKVYREATENERRFYYKEARLGFARALELDPDFAMAMLGMARMSEKEQAISLVRRAEKLKSRVSDREQRHID